MKNNTKLTHTERIREALGHDPETHDELAHLFEYGIFPSRRTVYLFSQKSDTDGAESGIDTALVAYVMRALDVLESVDPTGDIHFVLSSPGGGWDDALAIYDRILMSPCPTSMTVFGAAHSGAPVILQAADRRIMAPHATLLIHDGSVASSWGEENTRDVEAWGRFSSRVERPRMYEILARRSKYSTRKWKELCKQDFYLTAKKALDFRLVDEILDPATLAGGDRPRFEELLPKRS